MNIFLQYFLLGLTQGLTEFLPVSSSGHLYLLESLGIGSKSLLENLMLHLSTLMVVIVMFRKKIWEMLKHPTSKQTMFVLIASVPTAILAGIIRYLVPDDFGKFLPLMFVITSVFLFLPSVFNNRYWDMQDKGLIKNAIIVGITQGLACFNGISRSGATTSTMRIIGLNKEDSANICFILSIPIILGSSIVELITSKPIITSNTLPLLLAMLVAFVSGLFAVKTFIKVIKNSKLWVFAIYTMIIGIASFFVMKG